MVICKTNAAPRIICAHWSCPAFVDNSGVMRWHRARGLQFSTDRCPAPERREGASHQPDAPPAHPTTTENSSQNNTPPLTDAASRTCATALGALGVPVDGISLPGNISTLALPKTLTAGPETTDGTDSSLQAACLNLLSSASGYPPTPYLGTSTTEVSIATSNDGRAGYSCLVQGGKVIGLWGQQAGHTLQREFLVTVQGKTVQDLTGNDFLSWLIAKGYYMPHGVPNSPSFTAEQALENYFAVINDPTLSASERADLLDTYIPAAQQGNGWAAFAALVPIQIRVAVVPGNSGPDPTAPEFGVQLWSHFVTGQPTPGEMAGNGWQYMLFDLGRSSSGVWLVEGTGPGP